MLREMRKQLKTLIDHSRDHGIAGGDEDSVGTRIGDGELPKNESTSTTKVSPEVTGIICNWRVTLDLQ